MRRLSHVGVLVATLATLAACGSAVLQPDLALIPPGCRVPSTCYNAGCSCKRGALTDPGDCLACDPTMSATQQCDCNSPGNVCVEGRQLCVGKGPVCPGVGALCFPAGADGGTGDPPTQVGVDTGDSGAPPSSEARCAFADDVCQPGTPGDGGLDLSVPDLGNPPDLLGSTD